MIQADPDSPIGPGHDVQMVAVPVKVGPDQGTVVGGGLAGPVRPDACSRCSGCSRSGLPILLAVVG